MWRSTKAEVVLAEDAAATVHSPRGGLSLAPRAWTTGTRRLLQPRVWFVRGDVIGALLLLGLAVRGGRAVARSFRTI
jgi:hypothetical protein